MIVVDVIVPVYKGLAETRACIESVRAAPATVPFRLVVINDASPEPAVCDYLAELAERDGRVVYLENDTNRGFVGSVNRGLRASASNDVVVLNSDTVVANDWLGRLFRTAYQDATIASVTPLSNNATICSFPRFCEDNELPPGRTLAEVDEACARANWTHWLEIPTGVGFCMYAKRACLAEVGELDEETFGRGYGEENDWCRRALARGWTNAMAPDTFVYHAGAVSFGADKDARAEQAVARLSSLYPDYLPAVHDFIARDPARPARVCAELELLRTAKLPRLVMVSHGMGGGTSEHVHELARVLEGQAHVLLLDPGPGGRVRLHLPWAGRWETLSFALPDDYAGLVALCRHVGVSALHVHHLQELHPDVRALPGDLGVPYDVTLHDYYLINGNPTLADANGFYCERWAGFDACCATGWPVPGGFGADEWRRRNGEFLAGARRVFVPSRCDLAIHRSFFDLDRAVVARHPDWEDDAPYPAVKAGRPDRGGVLRVLAIGALNREKGADRLEAVAEAARQRGSAVELHLLGYAYRPLSSAVVQHGPYPTAEIDARIAALAPDVVWFPALWPETYSYTLSAALRSALPIVAPDLGAFPERLQGRPWTWVEPWRQPPEAWLDVLERVRAALAKAAHEPAAWTGQALEAPDGFTYRRGYVVDAAPAEGPPQVAVLERGWVASRLSGPGSTGDEGAMLSRRERILVRLAAWRDKPALQSIARWMPANLQRRVKRCLSRRPLHELITGGDNGPTDHR